MARGSGRSCLTELGLGEVDRPERDAKSENAAAADEETELELAVLHLRDGVHLGRVHVVRGARPPESELLIFYYYHYYPHLHVYVFLYPPPLVYPIAFYLLVIYNKNVLS